MYKVASDGRQRALSHGRLADWVTWDGKQSPDEVLRNMQASVNSLERLIKETVAPEEKKALGLRKLALQNELKEFHKVAVSHKQALRGLPEAFVEIAKETLSATQFKAIMSAALHRVKKLEADHQKEAADYLRHQETAEAGAA